MSNDIRETLYNLLLEAMEEAAGDTDRIGMADRAMEAASEILTRFDLTPGGGEEDPLVCPRCGSSSPEVTTYTYDGFGNLFRTETINPTNRPLGQVSSSVYDGKGRSLWKEAGNRSDPAPDEVEEDAAPTDEGEAPQGTTVTYDEFGNLIIRVEPDDADGATDEEATDEGDDEE